MKYAICNETFQDWPHERAFKFAAELGYTGIEIAPFTVDKDARRIGPKQVGELRRLAEQYGLEIIGLHWLLAFTEGFYLTSPEPAMQQKTGEYLSVLARLCRDLGGSVMVLGSPKQRNLLPGVTHEQALGFAAETIRAAAPTLEETGVVIAVEPLGPEEGDFLLTADAGEELIARVASPQVKLHLDVKAMSSEPTPVTEIIRAHARNMVHFHANDPNRQGPGMGAVDFVPIVRMLREIDYRGWISVEVFDYTPGTERLARESLENLRRAEKIGGSAG